MRPGVCSIGEVESFVRAAVPQARLTYFICRGGDSLAGYMEDSRGGERVLLAKVITRMRQLVNGGMVDFVQRRHHHLNLVAYEAVWRANMADELAPDLALPLLAAA